MKRVDLIVVGSGFGGAVTACRAAEAGSRVVVLERGRRWTPENYPRQKRDPWLYDNERPDKKSGWLDVRLFRGMAVAQGAGVGGGSLCYSSVVMKADQDVFESGWPDEISFADLGTHYDSVERMLGVQKIPSRQLTRRTDLLQKGAEQTGRAARFASAPLAVAFDDDYHYELPDPINKAHTKAFRNEQGRWQGTCVHLGNCDIGCDVRAKNTLDVNYIAQAERLGADVRPLHLVRSIELADNTYVVHFDRIDHGHLVPGSLWAGQVVIAAGSIGSTELLLRCRDEHKTLPKLSPKLGENWSGNGNFLTPAFYSEPNLVRQGVGPTISAAIDMMDGVEGGHRFIIEDDGFPNLWLHALSGRFYSRFLSPVGWSLRQPLLRGFREENPLAHVMVWLGAGIDSGDGQLSLRRKWYAPWARKKLALAYSAQENKELIESIIGIHKQLTEATGGKLCVPLFWRLLRSLVTVHPLGGCAAGNTRTDGVVDHRGEVFGYPNLFVIDGATVPRPIGRNPSMTIAALAERAAAINWNN